jgi:hypothetical protein
MIKPGAIIIDVCINRGEDGSFVGEVDYENVARRLQLSPCSWGIGPMNDSQFWTHGHGLETKQLTGNSLKKTYAPRNPAGGMLDKP